MGLRTMISWRHAVILRRDGILAPKISSETIFKDAKTLANKFLEKMLALEADRRPTGALEALAYPFYRAYDNSLIIGKQFQF